MFISCYQVCFYSFLLILLLGFFEYFYILIHPSSSLSLPSCSYVPSSSSTPPPSSFSSLFRCWPRINLLPRERVEATWAAFAPCALCVSLQKVILLAGGNVE